MKIARIARITCAIVVSASFTFGKWVPAGPFGGNAEIIAATPADPGLLLAGTKNANLYISRDAGASWKSLFFPRQYGSMLHTLVIDSVKPSVFYAAIADESRPGLYRSTDSGRSWLPVKGLGGQEVFALALWSGEPRIMAAGLREGVQLSRDGGETWKPISPTNNIGMQPVVSLSFDPRSADTLYAGTPRLPWKTTDGGQNWSMAAEGISTDSDILTVRVDPSDPATVFIGACSGFWRSADGGDSWAKMKGIPFSSRRTYAFAQDPDNPAILFAGTSRGLFRTLNGGAEWQNLSTFEIKSLAMSGGALYVATGDQGLFKSTDGGTTLLPIDQGFTSRNLTRLSEHSEHLYTSTSFEGEAGGIFSSSDAGLHWIRVNGPADLGYENILSVVRGSKGTLLAVTQNTVFRSPDGGAKWERLKIGFKSNIRTLCALPTAIVLATATGLYRTLDEGGSWAQVANAPETRAVLFAGSTIALLPDRLLLSKDDGASWTTRHLPFFANVADIAISGDLLVAATNRGVFRSLDQGETWHAASSGIPEASISAVAVDPRSAHLAYAFEYGHLYESSDAGDTWHRFDEEGLEGAFIHNFAIVGQTRRHLLALTNTRGIFVRDFDTGPPPASHVSVFEPIRKDTYVPNQQNDKTPAS